MDLSGLLPLGALLSGSFLVALASLWAVARFGPVARRPAGILAPQDDAETYLFDGNTLVDANETASERLNALAGEATDWDRFITLTGAEFPALAEQLAALPDRRRVVIESKDAARRLVAEWKFGLARISIRETGEGQPAVTLDRPSYEAMEHELRTLRETARRAPFLIWCQRADGTITWANNAYLDMARKGMPEQDASTWPPPRILDLKNSPPESKPLASHRTTLHVPGEAEPRWFECFETRIGAESLFMAVSADRVVRAEIALTLTKTFAHLTVGLAIFDKQRRLNLFNPALMDLTALPADFLSARPTLHSFLNRLRERKMLPEPKDYKTWRQQFEELESAAVNGTYEEIWSLTNGSTYRVVGRPHPDGAVAFLFEDISAEISLTRRFRAELDNGQAVLDSLDEAIAVFSPGGALTLSNSAYNALWGLDSSTVLGPFGIVDATRLWSAQCAPSPVWGDVREFVSTPGARAEWTADVRLLDGRLLHCRFKPIAGGATLAGFRVQERAARPGPEAADSQAAAAAEKASI